MPNENLNCTNCEIRHETLFSRIPESTLELIDFKPVVSLHAAQELLIPQASRPEAVYTVRKGIVKLEHRAEDGSRRIVRLLSRGDTLGLQAWQMGEHPHDAVALSEVELCRIPHQTLEQLQKQSVQLNHEMLRRICIESQLADMWITRFSTGSIVRRMANLLLYLAEIQEQQNAQVKLMSRDDMAAILGVRQESISRSLTQFKSEGRMRQLSRDTYALDKSSLMQIANNSGG